MYKMVFGMMQYLIDILRTCSIKQKTGGVQEERLLNDRRCDYRALPNLLGSDVARIAGKAVDD